MSALPSCLTEPIWEQFAAPLPERHDRHPLGCHRPRIGDRAVPQHGECAVSAPRT